MEIVPENILNDVKEFSPYYAQINFTIDIHPVRHDGSLDPDKLTEAELESFDITNSAIFGVHGFNKEDCISKLKKVLEGLEYE